MAFKSRGDFGLPFLMRTTITISDLFNFLARSSTLQNRTFAYGKNNRGYRNHNYNG